MERSEQSMCIHYRIQVLMENMDQQLVGLSGHKSIPLYRDLEAFKFAYDVVYTNRMSAGAYRGYGATQGMFALESAVNELAED